MTIPTDFAAWKAKALELVDECERCSVEACVDGHICATPEMQAARIALEAHLDDVPMGEPVAYKMPPPDNPPQVLGRVRPYVDLEDFGGDVENLHRFIDHNNDAVPLYRNPKEASK